MIQIEKKRLTSTSHKDDKTPTDFKGLSELSVYFIGINIICFCFLQVLDEI